jgi:hypothetical protein
MVGRVTLAVIPPGQTNDFTCAGALFACGAMEVKCFCHSIRPRSVSITKTLSELPPTNARDRNPRYPIKRSSRAGGVNELNWFGSFLSLSFQSNWKPGFCIVSFEIFASALIQDERCASPWLVIQSPAPRPWAFATPVKNKAYPKHMMSTAASLLIAESPLESLLISKPLSGR